MIERDVSEWEVNDALKKPLKVTEIMNIELSRDEFHYMERLIRDYPTVEKTEGKETMYVLNIPEDDALEIREIIADDLPNYFGDNYEPTKMVMVLESLIDKLFCY